MTDPSSGVRPRWAVPGGRVFLETPQPAVFERFPSLRVGETPALVVGRSRHGLRFVVPPVGGGAVAIHVAGLEGEPPILAVATSLATGLHLVDSPVFDGLGRLYVTESGGRGTRVPVPLYRISGSGHREPVAVEIANPTSLALGPDGAIYVSSRFEGTIYRLGIDDRVDVYASELGVPTGLAFGPDGALYVGDRSGTIFRVTAANHVEPFATLPASVAAFHLAFGPDDCLYVSAPTLASHDSLYRITPDRLVDSYGPPFGRPQGLAFDSDGRLHVVDALAGSAGLYRVVPGSAEPELVVAAASLVGVVFDPDGGVVLAAADTVWRLDTNQRPLHSPRRS